MRDIGAIMESVIIKVVLWASNKNSEEEEAQQKSS